MPNYKLNETGTHIKELQNELVLLDVQIDKKELDSQKYGDTTVKAISEFQKKSGLDVTSEVDKETLKHIKALAKKENERTIKGRVLTHSGLPANNVLIRVVDKDIKEDFDLTETEIRTDENGYYEVLYTKNELLKRDKRHADIEVHILNEKDKTVLAHSDILFDAKATESTDLLIDDKYVKPASQWKLLNQEIAKKMGRTIDFTDLKDKEMSFINKKIGIAIDELNNLKKASLYAKKEKIPKDLFGVLFEFGSSDLNDVYKLNPKIVTERWEEAITNNDIPSYSNSKLTDYINMFKNKNIEVLLSKENRIGVSTLSEILELEIPKEKQKDFLISYQDGSQKIDKKIERITELGVLTQNNAKLISKLDMKSPKELVLDGFFKNEKWLEMLKKHSTPLPKKMTPEIYAESMAFELKKKYPNEAIAVELKESIDSNIYTLMVEHNFKLGEETFEKFEKRNNELDISTLDIREKEQLKKLKKLLPKINKEEIDTLHRQKKIALTGEGVLLLNKMGVKSAYEFAQLPRSEKNRLHAHNEKVEQITTSINKETSYLMTIFMLQKTTLNMKVLPKKDSKVESNLESLFGSLDFCNCGHCSSILSPAAYMVELLEFLDNKEEDENNPLKVLLHKRPDLQYLELTCENTETILPYIDIVNEILEFYIDKNENTLEGYKQNETDPKVKLGIQKRVYDDKLSQAVYPFTLPFNQSIEIKRAYFSKLKISLYEAMEIMGAEEQEVKNEQLSLLDEEYKLFTTSEDIVKYYGKRKLIELKSAKTLAETLNISYVDLSKVLNTGFVNINLTVPLNKELCDFEFYELEKNDNLDFWKILRFVRLMHKMNWSISETDNVLSTLKENKKLSSLSLLDIFFEDVLESIFKIKSLLERSHQYNLLTLLSEIRQNSLEENSIIRFVQNFLDISLNETSTLLTLNSFDIKNGISAVKMIDYLYLLNNQVKNIQLTDLTLKDIRYLYEDIDPKQQYQEALQETTQLTKKTFLLQAKFKLTQNEMDYLEENKIFEFSNETMDNYSKLFELISFVGVKQELELDGNQYIELLKKDNLTTEELIQYTDWDLLELKSLLEKRFNKDSFEELWPDALTVKWDTLETITSIFKFCESKKILFSELNAFYSGEFTEVEEIEDKLKNKKRDALVDYILENHKNNNNSFDTPNELFEYFLIDVEMDSCMKTSRIKQAILTIQLFIDRCLLNLEGDFSTNDINKEQWKWMKKYRLWEANRKVFLYPENWLEAELRTDKTPFFKEFESEILQTDLNDNLAEQAFLHYLEKLDNVSKPEIVAQYQEKNTLHVVAKMNNEFFYRKQEDEVWTAWEKINLTIEENSLLLVVWKGRLFLFWINILKSGELEGKNAKEKIEVFLSWSEFYNNKWQPVKNNVESKEVLSKKVQNFNEQYLFDINTFQVNSLKLLSDIDEQSFLHIQIIYQSIPEIIPITISFENKYTPSSKLLPLVKYMRKDYFDSQIFSNKKSKSIIYNQKTNSFEEDSLFYNHQNFVFLIKPKITCIPIFYKEIIPDALICLAPIYRLGCNKKLRKTRKKKEYSNFISLSELNPKFHNKSYSIYSHYHAYVEDMIIALNKHSIEGVLDLKIQKKEELYEKNLILNNTRSPNERKDKVQKRFIDQKVCYMDNIFLTKEVKFIDTKKEIDFSIDGAYSIYNWEIFFHLPLSIATQLSSNQRFEEAQRYFHLIFNPFDTDKKSDAQSPWKFAYFNEQYSSMQIDDMLKLLSKKNLSVKEKKIKKDIELNIKRWKSNPFDPHTIGRGRPLAYQFQVVMKYLDNLIAWGDSLFRQNTMESINEAIQLYVQASNLLGKRPQAIVKNGKKNYETYHSLSKIGIDAFGNSMGKLELNIKEYTENNENNEFSHIGREVLYFCIPSNKKLITYWDKVEDRLFKIRHCMNIEGRTQQLSLVEAPIDPKILIKAKALGVSSGDIYNYEPPFHMRTPTLIQKALEIANEVKSLGQNFLSAIEKKEGEKLSMLRQEQEEKILTLVQDVKLLAWEESENSTKSLFKSWETSLERYKYYQNRLGKEVSSKIEVKWREEDLTEKSFQIICKELLKSISEYNYPELKTIDAKGNPTPNPLKLTKRNFSILNTLTPKINQLEEEAIKHDGRAAIAQPFPDISATPWGVGISYGGSKVATWISYFSTEARGKSKKKSNELNAKSQYTSFEETKLNQDLQNNLATHELIEIIEQIKTSIIREQISKKEYEHHKQQIKNSLEIKEFIKDKFSNEELYAWMERQIVALYNTSYKFAYEVAKKAEITMKHELQRTEITNRDFITYNFPEGYKGLLSGEALTLQLKQMEMVYLEANKRELELTKHISLQQLNPMAILDLKTKGSCSIDIPEWLFDIETAGHYMRRIKTVSLSIPCVVGTYTSINCTLTLEKSELRTSTISTYNKDGREESFHSESIVTSGAQNDSGVFELNLRDEKYLPFEGVGVISRWKLELPIEFKQFDYNTISDVIMHMRYTARADGVLKYKANTSLTNMFKEATSTPLVRIFSFKHDFFNEWHEFTESDKTEIVLEIKREHFPYYTNSKKIESTEIKLIDERGESIDFNDSLKFSLSDKMNSLTVTSEGRFENYDNVFLLMKYSIDIN